MLTHIELMSFLLVRSRRNTIQFSPPHNRTKEKVPKGRLKIKNPQNERRGTKRKKKGRDKALLP